MKGIIKVIVLLIFLAGPVMADSGEIYYVNISFDSGIAKIKDVSKGNGYPAGEDHVSNPPFYFLELLSSDGQVLENKQFSLHLIISPAPPLPGEETATATEILSQNKEEIITIPFHDDGYLFNLYDANHALIDSKVVSYLSPETCGNGKCELHENNENCAKDCPAAGKDGYCNLKKVNDDPDCTPILEAQKQASQTKVNNPKPEAASNNNLLFIAAGAFLFIILLIIAIIYYIKKRKKEDGNDNDIEYSKPIK
jgi:hypothetical protein